MTFGCDPPAYSSPSAIPALLTLLLDRSGVLSTSRWTSTLSRSTASVPSTT